MKKRILFFIAGVLLFFVKYSEGQTLKIIDMVTLQPIENVEVYNASQKNLVTTNRKGEALLDDFSRNDTLILHHFAYKTVTATLPELAEQNYKIRLKESISTFDEVIVAASRWEQKKREVPNKITVIPKKQVDFFNPQTSADLVSLSNEVFVQKSQMGGGSPIIRGFAANRVLIVVDGVRMNNAIYRSGNLQNVISIDPNSVENAEIIFGPGSMIYGSDALGGVMDFHTLLPRLSTSDKPEISGSGLTRYASANNEKTGHLNINFGLKKWAFVSSFSYSDFDDLGMGSINHKDYRRPEHAERINGTDTVVENDNPDKQVPSGYSQMNFLQKVRFRPDDKLDFTYGFHYSATSDVPRYDRLIEYKNDDLKYAAWYYGPQEWMMHSLQAKYSDSNRLFNQAKLTLAFQDYEESRHDRKFGSTSLRHRTETVRAFSANLDFDKQLGKEQFLFYGIDAVYNIIGSSAKKEDITTGEENSAAPRYPDGSDWQSYAAYVNYKENLSPKVTFNAGLRYNQILVSAAFDTSFYPFPFQEININTRSLNGAAGFVFRPDDTWQFNINASSGFRAPNIDDVGKVFDSEPGKVIVPNENLKPENAYNFDFGFSKTFGENFQFSATGFYTVLKNAMLRDNFQFNGQDSILYDGQLSRVQALVNKDKAVIYGTQVSLQADLFRNLAFKTFLTITSGTTGEGEPIRHVPPTFGNTQLIYSMKNWKINLYADYNGKISNENLAESEKSKDYIYAADENGNPYSPGWFTLNLKTAWQIYPFLQISAGVENILDHRYRPYSSGIVAPGRNFIISCKGNF